MNKKNNMIMWLEGMVISPHVFQQQDILYKENLKNLLNILLPNSFGFIDINIDNNSLIEGLFKINNLKAIMPNYLITIITEEDNLQLNFKDKKEELKKKDLFIFLNISKNNLYEQNDVQNYTYINKPEEVADLSNIENKIILNKAAPNYFLTIEETPNLSNYTLPICKVFFNGISFNTTNYMPPILNIQNNKFLIKKIKFIIEECKIKLQYIINIKNIKADQSLSVYSLANIIFKLESAIKKNVHPEVFFYTMIELIADKINLNKENDITYVPEYDHLNYQEILYELINSLIETIEKIKETYIQLILKKEPFTFSIEFINNDEEIFIGVEKNEKVSYKETIDWINASIIENSEKIREIKIQRSLGLKREIVESIPSLNISSILGIILVKISGNIANKLMIVNSNDKLTPNNIYLYKKENKIQE